MVQVLFDEGALVRDGAVKLTRAADRSCRIPPTVQGILAARIDRLPADAQGAAADAGGDRARISARADSRGGRASRMTNSNRMLGGLATAASSSTSSRPRGDTEYIFKHALTQEVAYNSVLIERRKQLHERTAAALESLYARSIDDHLAELAHHYGRSANPDKAVEYLTRAGQQALSRSAFTEAQAQLQQGLEWIKKLAESPERDARELELARTLAQVLMVTRGFAAPETRAAAERARELAEKSGNLAELVARVFEIFRTVLNSGDDYATAGLLADRILDLAQREGSPASFGFVCYAQVAVRHFRGDLVGAEEQFARWGGFLDTDGFRQVPGAAVVAIIIASHCAVALGHADSARERSAQGLAFALNSNNPYDLAVGRLFESWLSCILREPQRAEVAAAQALAAAEEHAFAFIRNIDPDKARLGASAARPRG